ncbi:MAG TPA: NAD(P)-binding domain-containing protein [Nocardioides sp.]|uniref:NAD(P)-binding domain-containing protein n=1 Tax=Nocardioides sp. TaxID=35761 RepID=UPI002C936FE9|nr:NAD(P)-binding domain-containing protein [Nocardioides sp.]HQR25396.1 NAD(P)-binding domain-containing protein [Nocardioides sp.]
MRTVTAVVVGAGHCGLAMSRHLAARSIDHVVLERGEVASSWRTQRWDSLRLLTPNWMTRLPEWEYQGDDPTGYLSAGQVADFITGYAAATAAPVVTGTTVTAVRPRERGFEVDTDQGRWHAESVVLAAGTTRSVVPPLARRLPPGIVSLPALQYRNPHQLPDGGVLVVGGSASGVQIAEELQASGRQVTLAVGEHVRVPRRYRGHDVVWWMDAVGLLDQRWDTMDDLVRARNLPSLQLVGAPRTLDLNALQASGVRVAGRFAGLRDGVAQFSGSLRNVCALADLKLGRLLDTIDLYAGGRGERPEPTQVRRAPLGVDLRSGEIRSVVWATGVRPDLSWLDVPVLDHRGRLVHDGGVTGWPGLYVLGLPLLRRRRSTYIDGAGGDADELATHLADHLGAGKVPLTRGTS